MTASAQLASAARLTKSGILDTLTHADASLVAATKVFMTVRSLAVASPLDGILAELLVDARAALKSAQDACDAARWVYVDASKIVDITS